MFTEIEHGAVRDAVSTWEQKFTARLATIVRAFDGLSRDFMGSYVKPPQGESMVSPWHGHVRDALARELTRRTIDCWDGPVGDLTPDLYTETMLFEIKTDFDAASIQCAVGQLMIYDALLDGSRRKVLVVPGRPGPSLSQALGVLDIEVLPYAFGTPVRFGNKLPRLLREA